MGNEPASLGALDVVRGAIGAGAGAKEGWRTVEVVEDVIVRCAVGRRFAWLGNDGGGARVAGNSAGPSNCAVEGRGLLGVGSSSFSSSGGDGVLLRSLAGDDGCTISPLLASLALLACLDGDAGILSPLVGLAKGLDGRSTPEPLLLIWDGRRTNGLLLTGESESALVGDSAGAAFVGDCVGVDERAVAGDWLFCRLKGDCRPESKERGVGRRELACSNQHYFLSPCEQVAKFIPSCALSLATCHLSDSGLVFTCRRCLLMPGSAQQHPRKA